MAQAPLFDDQFRATLADLLIWRRDVRRFRPDPLPPGLIHELLALACLAPSVGFSQPWRWVTVDASDRRQAIIQNFQQANRQALADFEGTRAALYARLKLAGLVEAPVHLAVFVDPATDVGQGLGRRTMPEMLPYSVVCAVNTLWLVARAHGIGLGWVSILDPLQVPATLDIPGHWRLVAYLCLGYADDEQDQPELEREGWAARQPPEVVLLKR
ncbi:MAG: 5,6-dimethylbenzimidazole synthase [Acidobacteria bacterium]|nr:5,6-dimethylbenzimidazole synthase [Acidobacteriota bacterium]